jgi:DNA-binding response OmpR family regulator
VAGVVVVLGPAVSAGDKVSVADDTVATSLQRLGALVRSGALFDEVDELVEEGDDPQCLVIDGAIRPDLAARTLRSARKFALVESTPAMVALPARYIQTFDPSSGFDDFIVLPCTPVELYARLRKLEWSASEFSTDERTKVGRIVIDRALHEVTLDGRRVTLTTREFALLSFLSQNRGRVLRRDLLLARVWGPRYEGGARTVDIHVRRLRAKLGDALPLETLRGAGYLMRTTPGVAPTRKESRALRAVK